MADGQELENLLIKVDSELGDLSGIDSAVKALETLKSFTGDAKEGAIALRNMSIALNQIDKFGKTSAGIKKAHDNIDKLTDILDKLSKYTGKAYEGINQLTALGKAMHTFANVGTELKGLDKAVTSINAVIETMSKLASLRSSIKQASDAMGDLGKSMDYSKNAKSANKSREDILKQLKALRSMKPKGDEASFDMTDAVKDSTEKTISEMEKSAQKISQEKAKIFKSIKFNQDMSLGGDSNWFKESVQMLDSFRVAIEKFEGLGDKLSGLKDTVKGIVSMIDVLKALSQYDGKASDSIYQMMELGQALQEFSSLGTNLEGLDKIYKGVSKMIEALQTLSEYKGKASQSITQFSNLGKALQQFSELGKNLEGLENIYNGILKMVEVLESLSKYEGNAKNGTTQLKNLGEALHAFNGLDVAVGSISDICEGIVKIGMASESLKGIKKSDLGFIDKIATAIGSFKEVMTGVQFQNVGAVTSGLAQLIDVVASTKDINVQSIYDIGEAIRTTFESADYQRSASAIAGSLNALTKAYGVIGTQGRHVSEVMEGMLHGFELASRGLYTVRENIEAIATDFTDALQPVVNSALFDTLERFKTLNDSYKNVGGLGQGLGVLLSALHELDGIPVDAYPITRLLTDLTTISERLNVEEIAKKFEEVGHLAQPIAQLLNALKYTDLTNKNTVLDVLAEKIGDFYSKLPETERFQKISFTLNAIRDLVTLLKGNEFDVNPDDNVLTHIAQSMKGFGNLVLPNLAGFVQQIKELIEFLSKLPENYNLNTEPIKKLLEALTYEDKIDKQANVLIQTLHSIAGLAKIDVSNFDSITATIDKLFEAIKQLPDDGLEKINKINATRLKDLATATSSLAKLKDVDPNKLNLIAEGLGKILNALGGIQGSNNSIKIVLDSTGVAEFDRIANHSKKTFDDFATDIQSRIQDIDYSSLFNFDAPLKDLKRQLREAEQTLHKTQKDMLAEQEKMAKWQAKKENPQEYETYRGQVATWEELKRKAEQYSAIVEKLRAQIEAMGGVRFNSDIDAMKHLKTAHEELEKLTKFMQNFKQESEGADPTSNMGKGFRIVNERIEALKEDIRLTNEQLREMPNTIEGIAHVANEFADAMERAREETERTNRELAQTASKGFGEFGSLLKGTGSKFLGSIGNISDMLGKSLGEGAGKLSTGTLQVLGNVSKVLGTVAKTLGWVGAIVTVVATAFKAWWNTMNKLKDLLVDFTKKCIQFARNMLSKVVGAFNAVAGAVGKTVTAVKSGAEILASALRKVKEVGEGIKNVFGTLGGLVAPAVKGMKSLLSLAVPNFVKKLVSANGSLKNLVKNTVLLKKAVSIVTRYFSMWSRMLMRKSITAFMNEIKQAFQDLAVFEKHAGDQALVFNRRVSEIFSALRVSANQWMGAFEPLINSITPIILNAINKLTALGENLAIFMAKLTGQSYYIRAKNIYEDYADSIEEANKSQKNLTNGLDELNILSETKDIGGLSPDDMFEKVPISGNAMFDFPDISDILDRFKDWLDSIDWDAIKEFVKDAVHRLMEIVNQILRDKELWYKLGNYIAELFNTLMEAINQMLLDFDPVATAQALGQLIIGVLQNIDWDKIHENVELLASKLAQFWNDIFANDELWNEIVNAVDNFLNEIVHYFDTFAWTFDFKQMAQQLTDSITKILQGFDWEQVRSAVEGWVKGLVDALNTAISNKQFWVAIGQTLKNAINNIIIEAIKQASNFDFKGFAESLKTAIQSALDGIRWKDFEDAVRKIAKGIAEAINTFFGDEKFLTKITTSIANFANTIIRTIDDFLKNLEAYDVGKAVATALVNGFNKIDWNTAFLIPAEAINALSNAIRGILDALPEGKSIADWLVEHFSLTYDNIDWDLIEQNLVDICDKIVGFINGLIENEDFWNKISAITLKGFKFVVDITESLKKIKWSDLGERIKNYINSLIQSGQIERFLINVGDIAVDLFFTIGVVITGVDWEELGRQIASGINNVINQLYANHDKIRQIIEDAFTKFSNMISSVLQSMLENNSFAKLGTIIGELLLGIISGINIFLDTNATNIVNAMNQFADGLVEFIDQHEDEIVAKLSNIIWSINRIIQGFFGAKGKLTTKLAEIIEQLPLDVLLGTIFDVFLNKLTAKLKMIDAIWDNLKQRASFTNFIVACSDGIYALGKKLLGEIWEHFKAKFNIIDLLQDAHILPKGGMAGTLIDLLQGLLFGNNNGEKESKTFSFGDFFDIKFDFGDIVDKWNKAVDGVKSFFGGIGNTISNIFGGKKKEVTVDVDDEINTEDNSTSTKQIKIETTNYGTIYADKIKTDLIETIDIIADTLHVKDIITDDGAGVLGGRRKMDEYYGENIPDVKVGSLTRDGSFDKIVAKILEITEKITAPLLEIAEKITTNLIEVSEKIKTPVLEVAEKITTPLIEAVQMIVELITASQMTVNQISAGQLSLAQITASNLNVSAINSSLLTVGSIVASTLRVGTIDGSISGLDIGTGNSGSGISSYINNLISGYTGYGTYDIKEPTFNYGGRFSDLTGLVPSAEDYFSNYLYDTGNGTYTTKTDVGIYGGMENPYSKVSDYFDNLLDSYNIDSNAIAGGYGSNFEGKLKSDTPAVLSGRRDNVVQATVQRDRNVSDMTLPDNAKYIRDYLMSFIGNENGVYGLMGNLYAESGLKSNNLQDSGNKKLGMTDEEYTDYINNGGKFTDNIGYGIAQWTTSDRKNNLKEFLNGRSVDDLDAQLEYLKYELENNYSGVLDTLKNATSIHEASNAVLTGFEKPKDQSQRTDLFRWGYGEDIASLLDEGDDQYNTQSDEDKGGYVGEFDEANVLGEKREGGYSFLDLLPTIFNYRMAEVYDIVDTWFGRLKNLVDAFMSTLYDYFYNMFALIPTGTSSFNLAELELLITDLVNKILKSHNEGINKLISTINRLGDKLVDAIKGLEVITSDFNFERLDELMGEHCGHLQDALEEHCQHICDALSKCENCTDDTHLVNNTNAKSKNTKAVERLNNKLDDFINTLGNMFSNITCNCNCNCGGNCGTCPIGGKETGTYRPDTLYGENEIGADTGTLTNSNTGDRGTGGTKSTGHGGGGYSPTTGGGSNTNAGGKNINYTENGQQRHVFAWVNGQMVRLSDDLPAELKDQIARGMYPLTYADGTYLSSDARNDILGFVKGRGWLLETGSKTAGQGTKNIGGGTGTGGTKGIRGGTTIVPKDSGVVINKGDILDGAEVLGDVRDTSEKGNPEIYDPATGEINRNFDQGNGSDNGWIDLLDEMGITDLRGDKGTELDGTSKGEKGTDSGTGNGTGSELRDHNGELLGEGFVSLFGTDDTYDSGSKSDVINPISPTSGSSKDDSEYPIGSVYRTRENIKKQKEENERNREAKAEAKRQAEEERKKRKEELKKHTEEAKQRQQERIKKAQEEKEKKKQEQEKAKEERRKKREEEKKQYEAEKAEKQKEKDKQKAEEKKKSEELLKKAKDLLKTVYQYGTEGQKRQAKIQYQNIMPDFNSYKTNLTRYNALKRIADEVKKNKKNKNNTSSTSGSDTSKTKEGIGSIPINSIPDDIANLDNNSAKTGGQNQLNKGEVAQAVDDNTKAVDKQTEAQNQTNTKIDKVSDDVKNVADSTTKTAQAQQQTTTAVDKGTQAQNQTTEAVNQTTQTLNSAKEDISSALGKLETAIQSVKTDTAPLLNAINACKNAIGDIECTCSNCNSDSNTNTSNSNNGGNSGGNSGSDDGHTHEASIPLTNKDNEGNNTETTDTTNTTNNTDSSSTTSTDKTKEAEQKSKEWLEYAKEKLDNDASFSALDGDIVSNKNTGEKIRAINERYAQKVLDGSAELGAIYIDGKAYNKYLTSEDKMALFNHWYQRFTAKGYAMGGMPKSGDFFVANENGSSEFIGSFGNKTVVANNDQIVTAVANGVSMANDRVVNAINQQTTTVENAIERKDLTVAIGDRQIAEANRRGQTGLGNKFVD